MRRADHEIKSICLDVSFSQRPSAIIVGKAHAELDFGGLSGRLAAGWAAGQERACTGRRREPFPAIQVGWAFHRVMSSFEVYSMYTPINFK